jgi:hypothetical protein
MAGLLGSHTHSNGPDRLVVWRCVGHHIYRGAAVVVIGFALEFP